MKLELKIKYLLEEFPELRDSDRKLVWKVWMDEGSLRHDPVWFQSLIFDSFMDATGYDTITRARRKVQEENPNLKSSEQIQKRKDEKRATKGGFIKTEEFTGKLF